MDDRNIRRFELAEAAPATSAALFTERRIYPARPEFSIKTPIPAHPVQCQFAWNSDTYKPGHADFELFDRRDISSVREQEALKIAYTAGTAWRN